MVRASPPWHEVTIETKTRVLDIKPTGKVSKLVVEKNGTTTMREFDAVIMATGHLTEPAKPKTGLYRSPYPVADLTLGEDGAALILGSSLSAIDAAVGLAMRYGRFVGEDKDLSFKLNAGQKLQLVMVSRKGTVPDADFFYPIPEEPLMIFTEARLERLRKEGRTGLLAKAVKLFKQQLETDDPGFLKALALKRFTSESFAKAYFTMRKARQGFDAMAENLAHSRQDYVSRNVVMWRYTMMRAHENFGTIVPYLDDRDLKRFRDKLAPAFADAYGCVPHLSISRLLALHDAGCLDIVALGDRGKIRYGAGRFKLVLGDRTQTFETLIDARGQSRASISDLGFKALDRALAIEDVLKRENGQSEDDKFRLRLRGHTDAKIFCISIPVMMERYPFAQGLVACSEAAEVVATAI
jgi:uncharacterized NAD(P)/FAD-binding protein YdhS